jgi:nuclear protein localization protein 4 homolog
VSDCYGLVGFSFALFKSRDKTREIISSRSRLLSEFGLNHGDMIYMSPLNGISVASTDSAMHETSNEKIISSVAPASAPPQSSKIPLKSNIEEDAVDTMLQKMDGMIQRKRDPKRYLATLHNNNRAWYLILIALFFQLSSWRKI